MDLLEIYKWTAIISGVAFFAQLGFTLFGFDADFDTDTDVDAGDSGGDHAPNLGFASIFLSFLSIRNVVAFFLAFSVTGYFGMRDYNFGIYSVIPAILMGITLVFFNMYLLKSLASIKRDTSVTPKELVGVEGTVEFPILGNRAGQGKVNLTVAQKMMTLFAITDDPEDIPRNAQVVVLKVMDDWCILVKKENS